jgi:hypothetical protein
MTKGMTLRLIINLNGKYFVNWDIFQKDKLREVSCNISTFSNLWNGAHIVKARLIEFIWWSLIHRLAKILNIASKLYFYKLWLFATNEATGRFEIATKHHLRWLKRFWHSFLTSRFKVKCYFQFQRTCSGGKKM